MRLASEGMLNFASGKERIDKINPITKKKIYTTINEYYIDPKTGFLAFANCRKELFDGSVIAVHFVFWKNEPLYAFRVENYKDTLGVDHFYFLSKEDYKNQKEHDRSESLLKKYAMDLIKRYKTLKY